MVSRISDPHGLHRAKRVRRCAYSVVYIFTSGVGLNLYMLRFGYPCYH